MGVEANYGINQSNCTTIYKVGYVLIRKVSLQTKILTLILSLILFVIILLTAINIYIEYNQTKDQIGDQALNVAISISLMPEIIEAFEKEEPSEIIQPIVEPIREQIGAEFIVVGNNQSVRYSHPRPDRIGKKMVGGDNDLALIHGQYYKSEAIGSLGPSLRGKAPIFNDRGDIIGIVSVGFLLAEIKDIIFQQVMNITFVSLMVLAIAVVGGILLTKSIRKDIFGLEPYEIASLLRDRKAVLRSIKEGIIAIDQEGRITIINHSARKMLDIKEDIKNRKIEQILPNTQMYDVLKSGKAEHNYEMILKNKPFIVNRTPIIDNGEVVGVVASFKDKTEIKAMFNTLSEVKNYLEELRAQSHEYTNKLYVISGLLQLGHYDEAINMIQKESEDHNVITKTLFEKIRDETVQAILIGKLGKASEKKIEFNIDENSSISMLPEKYDLSKIISILGNLIDNAIEAVIENEEKKQVIFFATDIGHDIIFEVSDNGGGIPEQMKERIFERGYSTKDETRRGYGLANIKEIVKDLNGTIEVKNNGNEGTVFTVYLPKD